MKQIKCLYCGKSNYVKIGFRTTENRGKIQRYKCKDCGRKFTNDEGFYRMRNSESKITSAIDLYFSNLSSRKVRNYFRRHIDHNVSHITVLDWCRKYVLKVSKYVDTLKPELSGQLYADETEIPRGCNTKRKGGDKFWCSVDWGTRYINATMYSPNPQNLNEAIEFLEKVKKSKDKPKYIQTDSAGFYPRAMRKVFSVHDYHPERTQHKIINVNKDKKYNVRIETVFSKIKDRVDDFRGLKALWSAPSKIILVEHLSTSQRLDGITVLKLH